MGGKALYGADDQAFDIGRCRRRLDTGNLQIPVAVLREMGFEHFFRRTGRNINVLCHRAADVLQHQHPFIALVFRKFRIQDFGIAETELLSFLQAAEGDAGDAGEVLSHIIDEHAGADLRDVLGDQDFEDARRGILLRYELPVVIFVRAGGGRAERRIGDMAIEDHLLRRTPFGIGQVDAGVGHLSLEKAGVHDGAVGRDLPFGRIRDHGLRGAVPVLDLQAGEERQLVTEVVAVATAVGDVAGPPALAEGGPDFVLPAL